MRGSSAIQGPQRIEEYGGSGKASLKAHTVYPRADRRVRTVLGTSTSAPSVLRNYQDVSLIRDMRCTLRTLLFQSTTEITPHDDCVGNGDEEEQNRNDS